MLSLSGRDVRRWRRAAVERRWMRAVVERRGQSPDACVHRMRATNQGLRYIRSPVIPPRGSSLIVIVSGRHAPRESLPQGVHVDEHCTRLPCLMGDGDEVMIPTCQA